MYRDLQHSDSDSARIGRESPWSAIALGATLQGIAHLLYAGGILLVFLLFAIALAGPPGRGSGRGGETFEIATGLVGAAAGLAVCANWIVGLVAGAVMASADAGGRARGVGLGLTACTGLVLLNAPSLTLYAMIFERGGGLGGMDPYSSARAGFALVFLVLCELMRLSLVGFYSCFAGSAMGKRNLSTSGQLVGVLTPVVLSVLATFSILVIMVSAGPRSSGGELVAPVLLAVNGGALLLLLLFGAMLMFRLAGAAGRSAESAD